MEFQKEQAGGALILRPIGRITSGNANDFELALNNQLDAGSTRIVLDLSKVETISSAGLRVVLIIGKRLTGKQGRLVLSSMRPAVLEVLQISGFLALFQVYPNNSQATMALEQGQ